MTKLKLTVNEKKTRVCKLPEEKFDFLGYTFGGADTRCEGPFYLGRYRAREETSAAICREYQRPNVYPRKSNFSSAACRPASSFRSPSTSAFVIMFRIVSKASSAWPRQQITEVIGIIHDVRFPTLFRVPASSIRARTGACTDCSATADRRALRTPSTFIPIARASMLISTRRLFDRSFQPHLDQMQHRPIDDSARYRLRSSECGRVSK